jgi:hypothetical protein
MIRSGLVVRADVDEKKRRVRLIVSGAKYFPDQ